MHAIPPVSLVVVGPETHCILRIVTVQLRYHTVNQQILGAHFYRFVSVPCPEYLKEITPETF